MKKLLIGLILSLMLCSCAKTENGDNVNALDAIIEKENYIILDVRTKEEYDSGHVVGAINIAYDEINENIDLDKDKDILVYCKSGTRSAIAYDTLTALGYSVYDLGAYASIDLEKK